MNVLSATYVHTLFKVKLKQLLNSLLFFKSDGYVKFLIIGHPRTGTSLLHTYLNSHINVLSLNEPLSASSDHSVLFKKYSRIIKAVGFKYFYEYSNNPVKKDILVDLLNSGGVKIIQIERKNYLRTYVSRCIAEKTNEWSRTNSSNRSIENKKIALTKEACLHAFSEYKMNEISTKKIIDQYSVPVVAIEYDVLVADPVQTMFEIQQFLGISKSNPTSLLVRQNSEPLKQLIKNYDDLKNSFLGTEFENFFED